MDMNNEITSDELQESQAGEIKRLTLELKKTKRKLLSLEETLARNKDTFSARQTLLKAAEGEKQRLESAMRSILTNCPDIILIFDKSGLMAFCTDTFVNVCGISASGLIRKTPYNELLTGRVSGEITDVLYQIFSGTSTLKQTVEYNEKVDFSGFTPRSYSIQITPLFDSNNKPDGAMMFFYDSTDLNNAKQTAERANESKSSFLATVSHEIRTPMNAVIGQLAILRATGLDDNQMKLVKGIEKSSNNLLSLINDILDFSKIDAGKLDIVNDWFDLRQTVEQLRSMLTPMFTEKGLEFDIVLPEVFPPCISGDEKRLSQILTNILSNALKYTEKGRVVFEITESSRNGDCIEYEFKITDSGIGIKESDLPRLFMSFEQLDLVKNKKVTGTGLGLVITKNLCKLMGGDIAVESVYGEGSVFTISLPFKAGTIENIGTETEKAPAFKAPDAVCLIVDDISVNLEIAEFMIGSTFDIKCDTASGGHKALDMAELKKYDIIFMDHMMPEIDGIETVRKLRKGNSVNKNTPVVALTANAISGVKEMFYENGFNGFLSKPMEISKLAKVILALLPKEKILQ
ncbi:MAG: response regulator [Ruminococcus sp.]|jgi:signal transduction histidine kinase/CheY-like chemotaxis protein|nr:response regulator [Ruminococcus sp.]